MAALVDIQLEPTSCTTCAKTPSRPGSRLDATARNYGVSDQPLNSASCTAVFCAAGVANVITRSGGLHHDFPHRVDHAILDVLEGEVEEEAGEDEDEEEAAAAPRDEFDIVSSGAHELAADQHARRSPSHVIDHGRRRSSSVERAIHDQQLEITSYVSHETDELHYRPERASSSSHSPDTSMLAAANAAHESNNHSSCRNIIRVVRGGWCGVMQLVSTVGQIVSTVAVLLLACRAEDDGHDRLIAGAGSSWPWLRLYMSTPLPAWITGYALGCLATLPLFFINCPSSLSYTSSLYRYYYPSTPYHSNVLSPSPSNFHTPSSSRIEVHMQRLRASLECFFAVWFVLGTVWVFGRPFPQETPEPLYVLCVVFLMLSCARYAMPSVVCAVMCCCTGSSDAADPDYNSSPRRPYSGSQYDDDDDDNDDDDGDLYQNPSHHVTHRVKGASQETIGALPVYIFKRGRMRLQYKLMDQCKGHHMDTLDRYIDPASIDQSRRPGKVQTDQGMPINNNYIHRHDQRMIPQDDAICCICLRRYKDNAKIRGLPCSHLFHLECLDRWLKINASCPLCKFNILQRSSMMLDHQRNERNILLGRWRPTSSHEEV